MMVSEGTIGVDNVFVLKSGKSGMNYLNIKLT